MKIVPNLLKGLLGCLLFVGVSGFAQEKTTTKFESAQNQVKTIEKEEAQQKKQLFQAFGMEEARYKELKAAEKDNNKNVLASMSAEEKQQVKYIDARMEALNQSFEAHKEAAIQENGMSVSDYNKKAAKKKN